MILDDTAAVRIPPITLDQLLARAAARHPDMPALLDPPNRESFTDGAPRALTYAEADSAVSAIAARLRDAGLRTDAVIGIQLGNTVENVLTVLGVIRAGMIAAPLPLLWRRADVRDALNQVGAQAIVAAGRIGTYAASEMAMRVAAESFQIRHVFGFGANLPDGVNSLDEVLGDADAAWALPWALALDQPNKRDGNAAAHVGVLTFDVTADGIVPVARNHGELIAGGMPAIKPGGVETDAHILTTIALSSFGGLALSVAPWLLSGGTLSLHHGFDADAFANQCGVCDTVVLPGPLIPQLTEAGLLAHRGLKRVLAAWRAPERWLGAPAWQNPRATLTDMLLFGETAVVASQRSPEGQPVAPPADADIARTRTGTLSLRGAMVPRHLFARGSSALPRRCADPAGFVDTGYPCRIDIEARTVAVTGPPGGIVSVGGYRFVSGDVQHMVSRIDESAFLMAVPDGVAGQRLAGISNGAGVHAALEEIGVNPLIAEAFRKPQPPGGLAR